MKSSPIIKKLARVAPTIAFEVRYEEDPTFEWDGSGPDPAEDGVFAAYDVDVCARTIVKGKTIETCASLGGHYEKPEKVEAGGGNVSGYLPQLLRDACTELSEHPDVKGVAKAQAVAAQQLLKAEMTARYNKQQKRKKS